MSATQVRLNQIMRFITRDFVIESFELPSENSCQFSSLFEISEGDVVLIKASFINPCKDEDGAGWVEDATTVFRRRIVSFVTRVTSVMPCADGERFLITAVIENITDNDRKFFFKRFFSLALRDRTNLAIAGKRILFLH